MYGPMDRNNYLLLKWGDEKLIADTTAAYGSRHAASEAFVAVAWKHLESDDLENAIRRFNQAWLLEPENPDVYWGFVSVLYLRSEYCEGVRLAELAAAHGPVTPKVVAVTALVYSGCGQRRSWSGADPTAYYARCEELLAQGLADPAVPRENILQAAARHYYIRGDYAASWAKVVEYRKVIGRDLDFAFVERLRAKMPGPAKSLARVTEGCGNLAQERGLLGAGRHTEALELRIDLEVGEHAGGVLVEVQEPGALPVEAAALALCQDCVLAHLGEQVLDPVQRVGASVFHGRRESNTRP